MTTDATTAVISRVCEQALKADAAARVLVIAGDEWVATCLGGVIDDRMTCSDDPESELDENATSRIELAIVDSGLPACREAESLTRLIARLRDRYARRVLVSDQRQSLTLNDYLGLGFERLEQGLYMCDPDSASRQREWNNPRSWANPENFDRYRW